MVQGPLARLRKGRNGLQRGSRSVQDDDAGWALTLADMMTLLLCFFVLLVSISVVDAERFSHVSQSMDLAMGKQAPVVKTVRSTIKSAATAPRKATPPIGQELVNKARSMAELKAELERRLTRHVENVGLQARPDAVAINLRGPVLFKLGQAELTDRARVLLDEIADAMGGARYQFTVEGHTDDLPIHTNRYPSNWELSSARAGAVARYFMERGFPADRFKVVGFADTRPLVPNRDTNGEGLPENRVRNRRVVLLVQPMK